MKKVVILAAEGCVLSTVASPMDMFLQAGVMWNVTMGKRPDPAFEVKIVTSDGQPVMALNQVPVVPACAMHDINDVDLIIIPSQGFFFDLQSEAHIARVEWLGKWSENGLRTLWILNHYAQAPSGPGGTRHFALARNLRQEGWDTSIIAASTELRGKGQRLNRRPGCHRTIKGQVDGGGLGFG